MAERKTPAKTPRPQPVARSKRQARPQIDDLERALRSLERRLKQVTAEQEALREKHGRQLANAKRAADRRLTAMMGEITTLRHFEARATAMERLLSERDGVIADLRAQWAMQAAG